MANLPAWPGYFILAVFFHPAGKGMICLLYTSIFQRAIHVFCFFGTQNRHSQFFSLWALPTPGLRNKTCLLYTSFFTFLQHPPEVLPPPSVGSAYSLVRIYPAEFPGRIFLDKAFIIPVSYTHLDVYKRQEGTFAVLKREHNLNTIKKRGIHKTSEECLLSAASLNLKRMIKVA